MLSATSHRSSGHGRAVRSGVGGDPLRPRISRTVRHSKPRSVRDPEPSHRRDRVGPLPGRSAPPGRGPE